MQNVEGINPYIDNDDKTGQVRDMFNNIARRYDRMNALMSFGRHRNWLGKAVRLVAADNPGHVLDVATGTADVAIAIAKSLPETRVTGLDLSEMMIEIGRQKVIRASLDDRITLECGDCLQMPFDNNSFDAVTVAYGVRNFENIVAGLVQMNRVLRPGGKLTVIELSVPYRRIYRGAYNIYSRFVIPAMGAIISRDRRAYTYLPKSIAAVPCGDDMCRLMQQAGFTDTTWRPLTFGACTIYRGVKP